jgi:Uma2 family endonuclease
MASSSSMQREDAMTVEEYFRGAETHRPMELVYGVVREPPAPRYGHQSVVTRVTVLLDQHVRELGLGVVCVSPVDVVLDRDAALVLQPDVIFISNERRHIIRERVWGAPDLVVEVLSRRTAKRDRTEKLQWYREYGVRECWLVDPARKRIEVVACDRAGRSSICAAGTALRSIVLGRFDVDPAEFFV